MKNDKFGNVIEVGDYITVVRGGGLYVGKITRFTKCCLYADLSEDPGTIDNLIDSSFGEYSWQKDCRIDLSNVCLLRKG